VAATGAYQRAHRPAWVADLPSDLAVLSAEDYQNPGGVPPGAVLVVGSGQTGCQLAEELQLAGRDVVLACGRAPWVPRRMDGRDIFDWLLDTSFMEMTLADLPTPAARLGSNPQASGVAGGHDLHYRTLAALGVELVGRVVGADADTVYFADDLAASVAFGDARHADLRAMIQASCGTTGRPVPEMPDPERFDVAGPASLALHRFGSVILTTGYRPAYQEWIHEPAAFDDLGFPVHRDGASTAVPGLYFIGVHFLRRRKSALLVGVGDDARVVAQQIALPRRATAGRPTRARPRSR